MVSKAAVAILVWSFMLAGPVLARGQEPDAGASSTAKPRWSSQILLMQNAFELAVQSGASDLLNQMSRVTRVPPLAQLNGRPQAHGFELPGWGMFFYVRVPGMSATVLNAWTYLAELADQERTQAGRGVPVVPVGVPGEPPAPPVSPVVDPLPPLQGGDIDVLKNPDAHYVQAVRLALIDTMLEDSRGLRLQPGDRLTVAAREESPLSPVPIDPAARVRTMYFEITGSDLAAYHLDQISLAEARKRVVVRTAD